MKIMLAWILFGYFDELIIVCELVVAAKKTEFNWCGFGWVMQEENATRQYMDCDRHTLKMMKNIKQLALATLEPHYEITFAIGL